MELTEKQERFCICYVETGNASEAYKRSYNAEKMKAETIYSKASLLLAKDKIRARIDELRKPAIDKAQVTLDSHLSRLAELGQLAESAGNYGVAVNAEIARGKVVGLYNVEKLKVEAELAYKKELSEKEQQELEQMKEQQEKEQNKLLEFATDDELRLILKAGELMRELGERGKKANAESE